MTKKDIINRIVNPTPAHYTIESLKRLAENNNIKVGKNIKKSDLFRILQENKLISGTPSGTPSVVDSNIGVTKYQSSMPSSFREEDFQRFCYFFPFGCHGNQSYDWNSIS